MSAVTAVKQSLVSHIYSIKCLGALHQKHSGEWGKQELQVITLAMASIVRMPTASLMQYISKVSRNAGGRAT